MFRVVRDEHDPRATYSRSLTGSSFLPAWVAIHFKWGFLFRFLLTWERCLPYTLFGPNGAFNRAISSVISPFIISRSGVPRVQKLEEKESKTAICLEDVEPSCEHVSMSVQLHPVVLSMFRQCKDILSLIHI